MGDVVLEVSSISKSFGPITAVRELSFEARAGEIIGLLGPNGAGKTTAIRVLSTILPPSRGGFTLADISHTRPTTLRQHLGVLPESAGYPLHQTGEEFLRYHARLFGHSGRNVREVASGLLAEVGLAERASSAISTYSRGMRQRLGVARALVHAPEVIFLDEPTLGLDPGGQRQMLALVRDVAQQRGATILLSTHFLDEVEEVCSRALILNHGSVVAQGTIDEIKRKGAAGSARIRVPADAHERAAAALSAAQGVAGVTSDDERGWLIAKFDAIGSEEQRKAIAKRAIGALLDADILISSFELEGGRLSDAFFALTGEAEL